MVGGNKGKGKEPASGEGKFPEGMRVLVVDDDPDCLQVLEILLHCCRYKPTTVMDARMALNMLRDGREEKFDLVITGVHMPDMDGFELLKIIGLEMDLPVIMLSVNEDRETMLKGITNGACDILVKPVHIKELKSIWQHVVRKKPGVVNHVSIDEDDACQRVRTGITEDEQSGAKSKKCPMKRKNDGDDSDENREITGSIANRKKPRVIWTDELHGKFKDVVKQLGNRAVPKKILQMMNVDNLTIESVASHLQKYRLKLKKKFTDEKKSNYQSGQSSSAFAFRGSNTLLAAPAHGVSIQSRNWAMGTVRHGGNMLRPAVPWLPDARRRHASGPPFNSSAEIPGHTMLDAFSASPSSEAYANILREKLLQASNVVPSSQPAGSFPETPNGGVLEPVNQFQVQPPVLVGQFSTLMNMASNTAPVEMANDNFSPMTQVVNGGSTSSALPNLRVGSSFVPTQMVNGGSISYALPELQANCSVASTQMVNGGENASGTLPMQDSPIDLRALADQPIYSNPFFVDDIYANMLSEDLRDDAFFNGGC